MVAVAAGTIGFIIFGALSDKIGRKWIMLAGMALAVVTYRPLYKHIYATATNGTKTVVEDKSFAPNAVLAVNEKGDSVTTTTTVRTFADGNTQKDVVKKTVFADRSVKAKEEKSKTVWLSSGNFWAIAMNVLLQILYVTMVYGPIAAFLVELFPTRIRYTSMSLPYHIGNGIFGGLTPLIATRLFDVSKTTETPGGDPFIGLWYPIIIAAVCFVIGAFYLPNKTEENAHD